MATEKTTAAAAEKAAPQKIRIKIPVSEQNPKDVIIPVIINGVRTDIKRGESVEVDPIVAEVLEQAGII